MGFEDFTLVTSDCGQDIRPIWLAFGGDEPTPIISTVNDHERAPGSVLKVNGHPVPLQRNAALELFKKKLSAKRIGMADGLGCRECPLYDVTATMTGMFFAATDNDGGYGHLGSCHLFAIEQIADVDARRTAVPAGGRFTCSKESWSTSATEAQSLEARRKPCRGRYDCGAAVTDEIAAVAEHWNDPIGTAEGNYTGFGNWADWRSADLLRDYSIQIHRQKKRGDSSEIIGAAATRTVCKPVSAPYPSSAPIACRDLSDRFPVSKSTAQNVQKQVRLGNDSWRIGSPERAANVALQDAAHLWQLELSPQLKQDKCMRPVVTKGDQFTWCSWVDQNSMQVISIELIRFGFLRHGDGWNGVPWILIGGSGTACTIEK